MPKVINAVPDAKLIIAGEVYGKCDVYTELINSLGIGSKVECYFRFISDP